MKKERLSHKTGTVISQADQAEEIEGHFSRIATLIGEKSRAVMLWNLLDGRAYTAGELSICANISKQACSNHLALLLDARILTVHKQGRHRYYGFANEQAAQAIENIAALMPVYEQSSMDKKLSAGIRYARTCYDHLAGKVSVEILQGLIRKRLVIQEKANFTATTEGKAWFREIGVDLVIFNNPRRKFAYACLDWSERSHHLAGALGAELLRVFIERDWLRGIKNSREILVTSQGKLEIGKLLDESRVPLSDLTYH